MTVSDRPQPFLGTPVPDWTPPAAPLGAPMAGNYVAMEKLDADTHAALLYRSYEGQDHVWDYLPYGPFSASALYHRWVRETVQDPATLFYAIRNLESGNWEGVASFLRIDPTNGSIEVGHINYSPALQRTRAATEAMYLMMDWAFSQGYRRYEWKCNALNLGSRRAAQRYGFSFEGVFRQATIAKGHNRDTAWFAMIDSEWPALRAAFDAWLAPSNFDAQGVQRERLGDLTRLVRAASDPAL
ncbi:GNAT family protein [uncultured Roseobacter sp.]|uniref:GNAT family N-acetyltransferase n=1 Tax=uncultured Roseobacter sp. TaxID=114847 RepID=UPI0026057CD0|nr:GNAT family protein [uncultured Roseobacter sp.]